MANTVSEDPEKGIVVDDTESSEITRLGSSSSPKSTWSFRQFIRPNSISSNGESRPAPRGWFGQTSTTEKESCQGECPDSEFPVVEAKKWDTENTVRRLQDCPQGYPLLAAFLDSDDNFMMYRRFGFLQSRLLLEKQEQLRRLEESLDFLDREAKDANPRDLESFKDGKKEQSSDRRVLMRKIEKKFRDYASLMQLAQSLTQCNRPSSYEQASLRNFINFRQPLVPSEQKFVNCKEDLLTLRPGREHAWLDSSIERALKWLRCGLIEYIFCSKDSVSKTDGEAVYYTRERIDVLVGTLIILAILVLLVVPIYLLLHLTIGAETTHSNAVCIGILLISTLLFSACISAFTRARRHEVLGAAAAYCAVMVVFLGSNGHGGLLEPAGGT